MTRRSRIYMSTASFTRPANTTAYAANDAVSDDVTTPTALEFTNVAVIPKAGGIIRSAVLHKSDPDTTNAAFTLLLFDTSPAVAGFDDNSAIAITDAEFQNNFVGRITFAQASAESRVTGDLWNEQGIDMGYQCATGGSSLFGVMVADAAYTPGSAEVFTIKLFWQS